MLNEFNVVLSYEYSNIQKIVADEITKLYSAKHNVDIYKILFQYDDTKDMFSSKKNATIYPSEKSKLFHLFIYFKTNKQFHDYWHKFVDYPKSISGSDEDGMNDEIKRILYSNGFDISEFDCALYHYTFESMALAHTYYSANVDYKEHFISQIFNAETMLSVDPNYLIVVYKSKNLLDKAKSNGEIDKIKNDYYNFIKKFDSYNLISKDEHNNFKHLFFRFDSQEASLDPRLYEYEIGRFLIED